MRSKSYRRVIIIASLGIMVTGYLCSLLKAKCMFANLQETFKKVEDNWTKKETIKSLSRNSKTASEATKRTTAILTLEGTTRIEMTTEAVKPANCDVTDPTCFIPYTFDDPLSYVGPIVQGWSPNQNRNMSNYIRPGEDTTTFISGKYTCLQNKIDEKWRRLKLVVIVASAPHLYQRRMEIRNTYGRFVEDLAGVMVLFLFGRSNNQEADLLEQEQESFCDIMQMDFLDSYDNCTMDAVMALKFLHDNRIQNEGEANPKFAMIVNDDSYVNLREMYEELFMREDEAVLKKNDLKLWGERLSQTVMYPHEGEFEDREVIPRHHLHYCPTYMYNQKNYPAFVGGSGYVFPYNTVECLYRESLLLPYLPFDDVFVTGFVRQMCNMTIVSDGRILHNFAEPKILKQGLLLYHKATKEGNIALDRVLRVQGGKMDRCLPGLVCLKRDGLYVCETSGCKEVQLH